MGSIFHAISKGAVMNIAASKKNWQWHLVCKHLSCKPWQQKWRAMDRERVLLENETREGRLYANGSMQQRSMNCSWIMKSGFNVPLAMSSRRRPRVCYCSLANSNQRYLQTETRMWSKTIKLQLCVKYFIPEKTKWIDNFCTLRSTSLN
jgi:hypothetical protein